MCTKKKLLYKNCISDNYEITQIQIKLVQGDYLS